MEDMPDCVLFRIFSKLASDEGWAPRMRCIMPRVCKRWAAIMRGPSSLYRRVNIMQFSIFPPRIQRAPMAAWFASRAGVLQDLRIGPLDENAISWLPVAIVEALGSALAQPQLLRLVIDYMECDSEDAVELLLALSRAPRVADKLETLSLVRVTGEMLHTAALGDALHLPQLRAFHLCLARPDQWEWEPYESEWDDSDDEDFEGDLLPEGLPQAVQESTSLEELVVVNTGPFSLQMPTFISSMLHLRQLYLLRTGAEGLPAGLTALSGLQDLKLVNKWPVDSLRLPPSLSALAQLTSVELHCKGIPVEVGTLPCLRSLTIWGLCGQHHDREEKFAQLLNRLELEELGLPYSPLETVPAAVTRQARLRRLDLHGCLLSELPSGLYLQQLEHIDLRQNRFSRVPPAALAAPRLQTLAMLGVRLRTLAEFSEDEPPLKVAALGEAELAAAIAAVEAKFGPQGNVKGKQSSVYRYQLEELCSEALEQAVDKHSLGDLSGG